MIDFKLLDEAIEKYGAEEKSLIATLILEGVAYYNMVTPEYNVNIIALMLWPAATYHFYLAVNKNKLFD